MMRKRGALVEWIIFLARLGERVGGGPSLASTVIIDTQMSDASVRPAVRARSLATEEDNSGEEREDTASNAEEPPPRRDKQTR